MSSALLIFLGVLLTGGILSGAPVGFVLLGAPVLTACLGAMLGHFDMAFLAAFPARAFGVLVNPIFMALPLFVLMGGLLERSDMAKRMMLAAGALFGERRGGIAYAVIIVGALLAASTGVIGATIFMLGLIALPAMSDAGYSPRLSAGVICASGSLGQIIPPSILLILLTDQVSNAYQAGQRAAGAFSPEPVSTGAVFAGAILPGLVLVLFYLAYTAVNAWLNPETCPPVPRQTLSTQQEGPVSGPANLKPLLLPLVLILLVLGSILGGVATATESAALGAAGALIMVALDRGGQARWQRHLLQSAIPAAVALVLLKFHGGSGAMPRLFGLGASAFAILCAGISLAVWQELRRGDLLAVSRDTARMVTMMILIVLGAAMLSLVFRGLEGDRMVEDLLQGLPGGSGTALLAVMAVIFLLGFIIEYVEIIFIVVPVAGPPLMAAGIDPVWFAILISMNLQMSFLTPPFGYALFYFRKVAPPELKTSAIYAGILPFILLQMAALGLVALFPGLATFLPKLLYG
ncbi:TRAP transporter large permease [Roseibium litorale]|uniref:TRAP transporter large permease subunit n=1 Tax=Roseibium litorale TaxID=2803841 RepID=A0ABR9CJY2_9HYPH|nr:TRAP transporter large permease subunit [Roseibium litorale]MBD8891048.1 TRAP transporter large permease subunit [Roseibium litorale]